MCGVCGFWTTSVAALQGHGLQERTLEMLTPLRRRGPDDFGLWSDESMGVSLAHTRLSILDTSDVGRQPMISNSGRFVLSYNGEIYNFRELRQELIAIGISFHTGTDSEVLVNAIDVWGVDEALKRASGMFALAVWDRKQQSVHLARDRFGIKPLFYGELSGTLVFGSTLEVFKRFSGGQGLNINPLAAQQLLDIGYIAGQHTILGEVQRIRPGEIITISLADSGFETLAFRYWNTEERARQMLTGRSLPADESTRIAAIKESVEASVKRHMVSDVPVGAFLSGGIDSSLVVSAMQAISSTPVRTFTVGFGDDEKDERKQAKAIAEYLGTDHTEITLDQEEALSLVPSLSDIYDEPLGDPSVLPTILVCREAAREVKVVLSGDGGDEPFLGYNRYARFAAWQQALNSVPLGLARRTSRSLDKLSAHVKLPSRVRRALAISASGSSAASYDALTRFLPKPYSIKKVNSWIESLCEEGLNHAEFASIHDMIKYLPDDVLTKVDRASMYSSLEVRVPLLDPELVCTAWATSSEMKIRGNTGKWILRRVLATYLPSTLYDWPKKGFGIPLAEWLRGPLREWRNDTLAQTQLEEQGILSNDILRKWIVELDRGRNEYARPVWSALILCDWLDKNKIL